MEFLVQIEIVRRVGGSQFDWGTVCKCQYPDPARKSPDRRLTITNTEFSGKPEGKSAKSSTEPSGGAGARPAPTPGSGLKKDAGRGMGGWGWVEVGRNNIREKNIGGHIMGVLGVQHPSSNHLR
jgi:hypothetical protein